MQVVRDYGNLLTEQEEGILEQMRVVEDFGIFVNRAKRSNFGKDVDSGGFWKFC